MVPSRVVRGGLFTTSTGTSSLPLGFRGLLLQVIVSKKEKRKYYCFFVFKLGRAICSVRL